MSDLESSIEQAAADPQSATADGISVSSRPIPEFIQADRYLRDRAAARSRTRGWRISKINPPGMAD